MRQFRIDRKNVLLLGLVAAGACGVSHGADMPLVFQDEEVAPFSALQVSKTPGQNTQTTTLRTQVPVLCGRATSAAPGTDYVNSLNPVFTGFHTGADFKFGSSSSGAVPGIGYWNYRPSGLTITADSKTNCYVLRSDGVHKAGPGLFTDTFEGGLVDPSVAISVVALPSFSNPYYTYYVDVRIPAELAGAEYRVRDGYDSSIFAFGGSSARYCRVAIGVTECTVASMTSDNVEMPSVVPAGGVNERYIVQRLPQATVQMPADITVPLVYAALFLPAAADDNLANNVAVGRGSLSDLQPTIIAPANPVPNFAEGTGPTGLSFTLADDTAESGPQQLNATVSIRFNGNVMAATNVSCAQIETPQAGETVRRTCHYDIPVFDPDFATDHDPASPGTYAPNVRASVEITATDVRGQQSTRSIPFHVVSSENDAPSFTLSSLLEEYAPNGKVPTLVCHANAPPPLSDQCVGLIQNFLTDLLPGPPQAADENATQGVFLGVIDGSNRLSCTGTGIFSSNLSEGLQSPRFVQNGASRNLDYRLNGTRGTAECGVAAGDLNFPAGQTYRDTIRFFRITVVD